MRKYTIVIDSSANLYNSEFIKSVPLSLTLGDKKYVDDDKVDVLSFVNDMEQYKGRTTSACPSILSWQEAFNDSDEIYAISLTSKLSGAYNSLQLAKESELELYPNKKIMTFDSLTTGPELILYVEMIKDLIENNKTFEEIEIILNDYKKKCHLGFMFKSLDNFAKNGRVNIAIAKLINILHLTIVGSATVDGNINPTNKCRGEKNGLKTLFNNMIFQGYNGGKVRISHTNNIKGAENLRDLILNKYPAADIKIYENKALCAYYTERYGILVGFEE